MDTLSKWTLQVTFPARLITALGSLGIFTHGDDAIVTLAATLGLFSASSRGLTPGPGDYPIQTYIQMNMCMHNVSCRMKDAIGVKSYNL